MCSNKEKEEYQRRFWYTCNTLFSLNA